MNKSYTMNKQIIEDERLRNSYFALAQKTFDISFRNWYENHYWTHKHTPYTFTEHHKVIANASANIIDTLWQGQQRRYIQIGTVMTDEAYGGQGLSRRLIEEIIRDWENNCDGIYLYANETVLDFYPKFGFIKAYEYQHKMHAAPVNGDFVQLDMGKQSSCELLKRCYEKGNPYTLLPLLNNFELLMFYCGSFTSENVYYSPKYDTICIADQTENTLECMDIYGNLLLPLSQIVNEIATPGTQAALLGFTPKDYTSLECEKIEDDGAFFVLGQKENLFINNKIRFPELSHT